jgi:hypothetical protein
MSGSLGKPLGARPRLTIAALAVAGVLGALLVSPDADARLVSRTQLRMPQPGNLTIARLELRGPPAQRRFPRLRVTGPRLPRGVLVVSGLARGGRSGRFTAYVVVVRRKGGSRARTAASRFVPIELARKLQRFAIDTGSPQNKQFPNAMNETSAPGERTAGRVLRQIRLTNVRAAVLSGPHLTPKQIVDFIFGGRAAATDTRMNPELYADIQSGSPPRIIDRRARLFGDPGTYLVEYRINRPVNGVVIQTLGGLRFEGLLGASQGMSCRLINPVTGECLVESPSPDGGVVIDLDRPATPGEPGVELNLFMPPAQLVAPLGDNRVVM